jgi:hypothetical protein
VSSTPLEEQYRPTDAVAGVLAAMSIFASLTSIFWHPLRLVVASILLALIAAGTLGMTIAVITGHPIW